MISPPSDAAVRELRRPLPLDNRAALQDRLAYYRLLGAATHLKLALAVSALHIEAAYAVGAEGARQAASWIRSGAAWYAQMLAITLRVQERGVPKRAAKGVDEDIRRYREEKQRAAMRRGARAKRAP